MSVLTFTSNRSALEGKQGKLKKDKDGNYEVLAGAYNVPNNIGEVYIFTERVKKLFTHSTMITKMMKNQLWGEADHPSLDDYRSKSSTEAQAVALWINRLGRISMQNASHKIEGVRWEALDKKVDGRTVYGVYIMVKPLNEVLLASLEDPNCNTAFSVRSFVDRFMKMGEVFCEAKDLITYDWIAHGGIALATKYNTPSLESESKPILINDAAIITTDVISQMDVLDRAPVMGLGNESSPLFNTIMIKDMMGWREVQDLGSLVSRGW